MSSKPYDQTRAFEVASFKANGTAGEFEALVSVFGNVDHGGDRVMRGAFAKSLGRWQEKGDPIPVIWNHMWDNPEAHIGAVSPGDAAETVDGLLVKGRIDLDNPFAKQVHRLLSERRVKEFSFGYNLLDSERRDGALELLEIDLFEVGPTLKGMNPATELLAVKALAAATAPTLVGRDGPELFVPATGGLLFKAGARHSKATLALVRSHIDALEAHFFAAGEPADDTPKSDDVKAHGGTTSEADADLMTELQLVKERLR